MEIAGVKTREYVDLVKLPLLVMLVLHVGQMLVLELTPEENPIQLPLALAWLFFFGFAIPLYVGWSVYGKKKQLAASACAGITLGVFLGVALFIIGELNVLIFGPVEVPPELVGEQDMGVELLAGIIVEGCCFFTSVFYMFVLASLGGIAAFVFRRYVIHSAG